MKALHTLIGAVLLVISGAALGEPETGTRFDRTPKAVGESANYPVVSRVVNRYARCVASTRPEWSDRLLVMEFLSKDQLRSIDKDASGLDQCFQTSQFDLKFDPLSFIGGIAEQRIEARFKAANVARLSAITDDQLFASAAAPKTTTEDFAMCLARRNPVAVRQLIATDPTSKQEAAEIGRLVPLLSSCLPVGLNIKFNKQTVRAYAAFGLYRLLTHEAALTSAGAGRS